MQIGEFGELFYKEKEPIENVVTWVYEEGSFVPSAKIIDEEKFSIVSDYISRPIQAYNSNGEKVWETDYDIYGRLVNLRGEKSFVPFRQLGQYEDVDLDGLYYNRFRYYDSSSGIYISQDPIGLAGNNPNFYAYVQDCNIWVDVFGLDPITNWNAFQTSTSGWFNSRAEASTGWKVHKESSTSIQDLAIGRLADTEAAEKIGMRRLNTAGWTPSVNDSWMQGGIDANKDFHLASQNIPANRITAPGSRFPTTVFDRELNQLDNAGYKQKGDKMTKLKVCK